MDGFIKLEVNKMDTIIKLALALSEIHNDIILRLDFQFNTITGNYCGSLILGDNTRIRYDIYDDGRITITQLI